MKNSEVAYICNAIKEVAKNATFWGKNYEYKASKNDFELKNYEQYYSLIEDWFRL